MKQHTANRPTRKRRALVILGAFAMLMTLTIVGGATDVKTADAGSRTCTSAPAPTLSIAKDYYRRACGQKYDSQSGKHQCAWVYRGWTCKGPKTTGKSCSGHLHGNNITKAKRTYQVICGEPWNGSSGKHYCKYVAYGNNSVRTHWICTGPSSR